MRLMATFRWDGMCMAELKARSSSCAKDVRERGVPDDAVCPFANDIENLVVATHDKAGYSLVGHGGVQWPGDKRIALGRAGPFMSHNNYIYYVILNNQHFTKLSRVTQ